MVLNERCPLSSNPHLHATWSHSGVGGSKVVTSSAPEKYLSEENSAAEGQSSITKHLRQPGLSNGFGVNIQKAISKT